MTTMNFKLRASCVLTFLVWPWFAAPAAAQLYESIGLRAQGMSGAFIAVSDDATTTWWNPAGLAGGGFFNAALEFDRTEESSDNRGIGFAVNVPSLGLSYYRLSLSGMRLSHSIGSTPGNREDEGALNQFGATVGQSVGSHLIVASTAKILHTLDETRGDLDVGAMGVLGRIRVGIAVKNLTNPEFTETSTRLELPRQVRTGVSYRAGAGGPLEFVAAVDADLTTTPTVFGDARHLAGGAEAWLLRRMIGVRFGVGVNTVGERRRSGSIGASVGVGRGFSVDTQLTRGDDDVRNGWGLGLRLTF